MEEFNLFNICSTYSVSIYKNKIFISLSFIWSKYFRAALRALRCYRKIDTSIQWLLQTYKLKYRSQEGTKMLFFMYMFEV